MFLFQTVTADRYVLQLFYKAVLQSILYFGLIFAFGNMQNQHQDRLQCMIKMASEGSWCCD